MISRLDGYDYIEARDRVKKIFGRQDIAVAENENHNFR